MHLDIAPILLISSMAIGTRAWDAGSYCDSMFSGCQKDDHPRSGGHDAGYPSRTVAIATAAPTRFPPIGHRDSRFEAT
ncbi:hypothetical protein [Mycobacterium sp. C31M]